MSSSSTRSPARCAASRPASVRAPRPRRRTTWGDPGGGRVPSSSRHRRRCRIRMISMLAGRSPEEFCARRAGAAVLS
jgi:hypothetical protein